MTLKNAAFLALIGMCLLTILVALDFMNTVIAVIRGLVPDLRLLTSLVYLLASLGVTAFFYVFHKKQS